MSKVLVVILAAGAATRFGGVKQNATVAGVSLAARALRAAAESGADRVRIVVGAHSVETIDALAIPVEVEMPPFEVVENPHWENGQASSIATALAGTESEFDAVLIMPVDQPFLDGTLLQKMIEKWRSGARLIAPLVGGEMRGAPALFGKEYFGELLALAGDMGGRAVLRRHAGKVVTVAVAESQLVDIDTRDDLKAAEEDASHYRKSA